MTTAEPTASLSLSVAANNAFSGDTEGQRQGSRSYSRSFQCDPALPEIIGMGAFLSAVEVTCEAGEWHLADLTDPFQGMGDSLWNDDQTPVGKSLNMLLVISADDNEDSVTIRVPAANGCPILKGTTPAYEIKPGGVFLFLDPTGELVSALARGTNDIITIEISGGAPVVSVLAIVGP
jgi:hypothetical protein